MKKKKLLFILPKFYTIGGLQSVIKQRLNYLNEFYDIVVFETNNDTNQTKEKFNFEVISINYKLDVFFSIVNFIKLIKKITQIHNPHEIIVLDNGWKGLLIPYILKSKKVSYERHGAIHFSKSKSFFFKIKIKLFHLLSQKFDRIFFLNESMAKDWYHKNKIIIPNGIKIENDLRIEHNPKRVIWVGRESIEKGLDTMIEIWKKTHSNFLDWELLFYTPKPIGNINYQECKSKYRMQNIVGECDLKNIYSSGRILANTSRYEGFGLTLLEAMHFSLPIISFNCEDGPRYLIENEINGYLVENQNTNEFSYLLSKLMNKYINLDVMKEHSYNKSLSYDIIKIHQKWLEIYK